MIQLKVTRRRLRAAAVTVTATALATAAAWTPTASADPLGDARARAAALARTVDRLNTEAEVATEKYDALEAKLGQAVTARMSAQQQADQDLNTTVEAQQIAADRLRALYESGGTVNLLATVLEGSSPSDAVARLNVVSHLLSNDAVGIAAAQQTAQRATANAQRLATLAEQVTRLQSAAAAAATRVRRLLDTQRKAYAAASAQVRALVAQAQAAAAAASAQAFADALAAAGGSLNGSTTPPNAIAAHAIAMARTKLGDPYVWGGTGPSTWDCSGLTQWAYGQAGIALPRVAADQWHVGTPVSLAQLEPGDLLFWATDTSDPATIHHVAIYLGGGMMLAAPHTGDVVKIEPVYLDGFIGATRPYAN